MTINVSMSETDLRKLIVTHLSRQVGFELTEQDVLIEVKSKQNYKSEWERAEFRAVVNKMVL